MLWEIRPFLNGGCGELEKIIDPLNQETTFSYDLQGRLTGRFSCKLKLETYDYETIG